MLQPSDSLHDCACVVDVMRWSRGVGVIVREGFGVPVRLLLAFELQRLDQSLDTRDPLVAPLQHLSAP